MKNGNEDNGMQQEEAFESGELVENVNAEVRGQEDISVTDETVRVNDGKVGATTRRQEAVPEMCESANMKKMMTTTIVVENSVDSIWRNAIAAYLQMTKEERVAIGMVAENEIEGCVAPLSNTFPKINAI